MRSFHLMAKAEPRHFIAGIAPRPIPALIKPGMLVEVEIVASKAV